jgi:hypothetical protein
VMELLEEKRNDGGVRHLTIVVDKARASNLNLSSA